MATIVYGTHVFTKFKGYYGPSRECPTCGKTYKQSYVKYNTWAHLEYIPLFPVKMRYVVMCPVCGDGVEMKSKDAKAQMEGTKDENQKFDMYAKHFLARKSKPDTSYEFYVKDLNTNEEFCVETNLMKSEVKQIKKGRGLKKVEIYDV